MPANRLGAALWRPTKNSRLFIRLCTYFYMFSLGTCLPYDTQAGFFRFAAYNINDSESWHNYAACRQLAYGDYAGASEGYLKALEINPKDPKLQVRGVKVEESRVRKI